MAGGARRSGLCSKDAFQKLLLACAQAAFYAWVVRRVRQKNWEFGRWCSNSAKVDCHSPENRLHESNVTQLRVVAPALGQTGTSSIMDAMRELGLRSYHADDYSVMAKEVMFDRVNPIAWANAVSRCRMQAISLEPVTDLLPLVLSVSPKAKVILSWRDYPSWSKSTGEGGITKDRRVAVVMQQATAARTVFPWIEWWDRLTGSFHRARQDGRPIRQPLNFYTFLYRLLCNGYAWPNNNVYSRGTYKVYGHEEAYLAQINEVRAITPPGRLVELDVKTATMADLEQVLGLPQTFGKRRLPQTRNKASRTNDPFLDGMSGVVVGAMMFFMAVHALNYFVLSFAIKIPFYSVVWLASLRWRSAARSHRARAPAAADAYLHQAPAAADAFSYQVPAPAPVGTVADTFSYQVPAPAPASSTAQRGLADDRFKKAFQACPVVAILRGLVPSEALASGQALVDAGVTIVEVPLNSPDALESIRILAQGLPEHVVVGAGTVLTEAQVSEVAAAGGSVIVSPNMDGSVIQRARASGLVSLPGVATPTEALAALEHGASGLKAFPGEQLPPKVLRAWRAILPQGTLLLAVGGVTPENVQEYRSAGVSGFGVGSALFRPGDSAETIRTRAETFVRACRS